MTRLYGNKRIWITEYGYQTNPPDRIFGVSWANQARYLKQAYGDRASGTRGSTCSSGSCSGTSRALERLAVRPDDGDRREEAFVSRVSAASLRSEERLGGALEAFLETDGRFVAEQLDAPG